MGEKSRTAYSVKNTTVSLISRLTAIGMGYLLRIVFTHTMSESYVGVNGLFLDIINVLSLSELGVGTAVTYALYAPIAKGDIEKQKSLMRMYARFYRMVAVFVAACGLLLIPFLPVLIKDGRQVEHLNVIYLLYLANTVGSYLLIYKKTLMDAHQLLYIGTMYQTISWACKDVLQMLVLVFTKNFILFLLLDIFCTVACNICISRKADALYPYLKERDAAPLTQGERRGIFQNIRAMMMHKAGTVIVNNTDNLLLSAFAGLASAGSYSNYYLVIGSVRQLSTQVFQGITASVGNLGVTEDKEHIRRIFETVFFLGQWIYGFCVITLFELLNPFVELSFGRNYLFSDGIVFVLCVNFFLTGMRNAALTFRDSLGLFWYDRYKSVAEAVVNLVFSLVFVNSFGTIGVFLGTMVSTVATSLWVEPYILYKYEFQASCAGYFLRYFCYALIIGAAWLLTDLLCARVTGGPGRLLFLRLPICVAVPNALFLLVYARTREFRLLWEKMRQYTGAGRR